MVVVHFLFVYAVACAYGFPNMEDPNLFEGDMVLDPEQLESIRKNEINSAVPLAASKTKLWPRHIPYDLDELKYDGAGRYSVETAIKEIEKHTCLRFYKRTDEKAYMRFTGRTGCFSHVGYNPRGYRAVNLGRGCREPNVAIHEIMHALGFHHEQSRPDRDDYITIKYENINKGLWSQFTKYSRKDVDSLGSPYDYYSIMHYRKKAFSNNGQVTMVTKDPKMADVIGEQKHLSKEDIIQINKLYKCDEPEPTTRPPTTLPVGCKDISAVCNRHLDKCTLPKDNIWFKWVSKECKRTCKLCDDDSLYYDNMDDSCVDRYDHCDRHKDKCKHPSTSVWYNWVRTECKKTCDVCDEVKPTTKAVTTTQMATKATDPVCEDDLINCDAYQSQCLSDKMRSFLKTYCKRTCGYCGNVPVTTPIPGCFDTANCAGYVVRGYCKPTAPAHFYRFMKKSCIKSCGWCSAPTAPPPFTGTIPPRPTNCGISSIQMSRVIGGTAAVPGAWPWIARLYRTNSRVSYCGGALISPTWVVTAAHCVRRKSSLEVEVHLGRHTLAEKPREASVQALPVRRIIVHPEYNKGSVHNNDVALLELGRPAQLNDRVKTVCLPNHKQDVPVGTDCWIAGWGKTKFPGTGSMTLQQTNLQIVKNSLCNTLNVANIGIPITKSMVCAGLGVNKVNSACHGDSGGPLMCKQNGRFVLHGDVSWGHPRCKSNQGFSVFGRMSEFKKWIDTYVL